MAASRNLLRADGAKAFGDALKVNKTITEIDLSDNEIGAWHSNKGSYVDKVTSTPEGPAALADGLKDNTTVTKVSADCVKCTYICCMPSCACCN